MALLNQKLQKDQPKEFGPFSDKELNAMEPIQEKPIFSTILALLYAVKDFSLDIDACNVKAGCLILQDQPK